MKEPDGDVSGYAGLSSKRAARSIAASLLLVSLAVDAGVYRCVQDGQVIFSQLPCGENAQRMELDTGPEPPATPAQPAVFGTPSYDVDGYIEESRYRRRLEQLKGRSKALAQERDRRIADLEKQIPQASNYSVYSSIRRDINNIRSDYNRKISQVDAEMRAHMRDKPKSLK